MDLANGAIKDHMLEKPNSNIGWEHLVNHTEILRKHSDTFRMLIHEALHIKFNNPDLNRQDTGSRVFFCCCIITTAENDYINIIIIILILFLIVMLLITRIIFSFILCS